ncbi:MAG TPA: hypothetical protein PKD28_01995 [Candidatus Saccharibacteria bacterium]|nr:hypothetical protein [Candidatus Saccharibacteria bacterium]
MDQQPAPQAPTPPQVPTGAAPQAPAPYGQPPKKNTGLIIGIVAGIVILIAGVATVLALTLGGSDEKSDTDKKDSSKNSSKTEKKDEASDEKLRAANAKTATSLTQFNAVCDTGSISNAAEFTAPYKVAAFSKSEEARSWTSVSLAYNADYNTKYDDYTSANVVVCVEEKPGTAVKANTCEMTLSGETKQIDYYATKYTATAYEAKSGKKVADLGEINGPATTCPYFASISDRNNPKLYASPDSAAVDAAIVKFIAEQ